MPSLVRSLGFGLGLLTLTGLVGCDPCKRACRHVFDECGLSDRASDEEACEERCEVPSTAEVGCAARFACFEAASCEELKAGQAAARCSGACGS